MKIRYNARACSVLYNVLKSNLIRGTVLMPSNICESVPATYMLLGIKPFFCDISLTDYQLDKDSAFNIIEHQSIDILHYNHTFGYLCEEDEEFLRVIRNNYPDMFIVDDRCLCYPEFCVDGSVADLVLYSTGTVKCVDIGWGGYGIISDKIEYHEFERHYSIKAHDDFERHIKDCHKNKRPISEEIIMSNWIDLSIDDGNDYYETVKNKMKESIEHRLVLNDIYRELPGSLPIGYCNWRYQIILENAQDCLREIFNRGLFCSNHYMSLGNGYFSDVETPNNNYLERHILNLFNDFRFTVNQARFLVEILSQMAIPIEGY